MVQKSAGIGSRNAAACIGAEDGLAVWTQCVACHSVTAQGRTPRQFQLIVVDIATKSISVAPVIGIVPGHISAPEGGKQEGMNLCPKSLRVQDSNICCSAHMAEFWEYGPRLYKKLNQNWKKFQLNMSQDYLHSHFSVIWFTWISYQLLRTESIFDFI